jgi:hypothetical protein
LRCARSVAVGLAALSLAQPAFGGGGSFVSNDAGLNAVWAASVRTAHDVVGPPVHVRPGCGVPKSVRRVILDGVVRDRCMYVGDLAVTGMTLYVADGAASTPMRSALFLFAERQRPDGAIPATTSGGLELVDYTGYWVEDVYDYVLYSGDVAAGRTLLPALRRALDVWYPAQMDHGLMANNVGSDYAFINRRNRFVAYYNAQYVRALDLAGAVARWARDRADARRWDARATALRPAIARAFWDAKARAFKDTVDGPVVHPQDGNVFAVLSGVASRRRALSALAYLDAHDHYGYGNSIADNQTWDGPVWGRQANLRVYPFMSYFELLARFKLGLDDSAFSLLRREWEYMLANGPKTTMWESIGPYGGGPPGGSWDHGWSSGAAPALTSYVLGVRPTSPGFRTFVVRPHPGGLGWAKGAVPTPHGLLRVSWAYDTRGRVAVTVQAPPGTRWVDR